MEVSGALVQHIEQGHGICSSSSSLGCAVLGDICISEALKLSGDLTVPNVVCNEKSICAGSFQSASLGFSDKQVNRKVDSITDDPKFEKNFREKKKSNKKRTYSSKKISDKIVSVTGESKYGAIDAKPSSPSMMEDILSPALNCEKGVENNTPLVNSTSLRKIQVKLCTEDLIIHNCNSRTCCKVPDENKQGFDICNSSHAVRERNVFKSHNLASELDAVNKTGNHQHIMTGKENSQSAWQKKQRILRETQTSEANNLQCNYLQNDASMLQKNLFVKHNSFFGKGLLPTPIESSRHIGVANAGNKETKTDVTIHQTVLVESPQWVAQQRLNRRHDRHVSQSSATCELHDYEEQKLKTKGSFNPENYCRSKKGLECQGHNFLRPHNNSCLCRKKSLEVPLELNHYKNPYMAQRTYISQHGFSHAASNMHSYSDLSARGQPTRVCSTKFTVPVQRGFRPYSGLKIPGMNHLSARSFHASAKSESYMKFEQFNENQFRKDVTSRMNAKKWVPAGTKGSSISEKTGSAGTCHVSNADLPFLHEVQKNGRLGRNVIDNHASAMLSKSKGTNLFDNDSLNIVETEAPNSDSQSTTTEVHHIKSAEIRMKYVQNLKDVQQLIIGLPMVTDPLNAAYKMQLASEGFELETGCPLAEFERFLHFAAPAIPSLYQHGKCSLCLVDQMSNSFLCKHQIPNTSLVSIWNWYEEPGNYGLKVKVGDSENLKGRLTESTSFHAHFVPYLSALRLFGSCGTSEERSNSDMHIRNSSTELEGGNLLVPELKFGSLEENVNAYKVFCPGGHSQSFIPSPDCSSNCELVFEYFETEKPWLRRPLHNKIMDLYDAEASYLPVFGDISKLKSLKLNDLHPASWFSVAWYPIYRIPEGKFGAAFLTYHSLGHMVRRDVPTGALKKKTLCVVSPVVGLLSYKAQAESWFDLKIPEESSIKDSSLFNRSEILREQLKILKENASLFARGCVWTDGIQVVNRHRDYEFFSSQK